MGCILWPSSKTYWSLLLIQTVYNYSEYCSFQILRNYLTNFFRRKYYYITYLLDENAPDAITVANVDKEKYPEPFFSSDLLNKNDLELVDGQAPTWWNYFLCGVKGVVGELLQNRKQNGTGEKKNFGYIALMDGKIPPSAGLSSSSAVVVAAAVCK